MLHISKRAGLPAWKAWLIRGAAIVLALIVCAIVTMIVTGLNPITVFKTMFDGTLGSSRRIWVPVSHMTLASFNSRISREMVACVTSKPASRSLSINSSWVSIWQLPMISIILL